MLAVFRFGWRFFSWGAGEDANHEAKSEEDDRSQYWADRAQ